MSVQNLETIINNEARVMARIFELDPVKLICRYVLLCLQFASKFSLALRYISFAIFVPIGSFFEMISVKRGAGSFSILWAISTSSSVFDPSRDGSCSSATSKKELLMTAV